MLNRFNLNIALLSAFTANIAIPTAIAQETRHTQLKNIIFDQAYSKLPSYKVTTKLFKRNADTQTTNLLDDAKRTLHETGDLLGAERGQKLMQANGICFSGQWQISQDNQFSGVFKKGFVIPVIARISTTFSGTLQSERRALGLAIKLLPNDLGTNPSLNVFSLHSVGGVTQKHLYDLSLDNEPPLGRIPRLRDISTALKLKNTLLKADREAGSDEPSITYRNVNALANYGESSQGRAPKWIRFSPAISKRVDRDDFRDELRVGNYPNQQLVYNIEVGDHPRHKKKQATWQLIGQLVFDESITSKPCDTRLHFAHPLN